MLKSLEVGVGAIGAGSGEAELDGGRLGMAGATRASRRQESGKAFKGAAGYAAVARGDGCWS